MDSKNRSDRKLPAKEATLFRQILSYHEEKNYKKALKNANVVLKKFPDHGETLALKAMVLNSMQKKDEAISLVKLSIMKDMTSHICWHVYGLIHRSNRDYQEAIKCYRNALRHDAKNIQILRDLAHLQVQMRNVDGLVETRKTLLQINPKLNSSWIGYALSLHLAKNYAKAVEVLSVYEDTLKNEKMTSEISEMLLYKASLLEEAKEYQRCLDYCDDVYDKVFEKIGIDVIRGRVLLQLGNMNRSEEEYRKLIDINADCLEYHRGLRKALKLEDDDEEGLTVLYSELAQKYPKSLLVNRMQLDFTTGDAFLSLVDDYFRRGLRKGIPSIFVDLKPLYEDGAKTEIIDALLSKYESSFAQSSRFPGGGDGGDKDGDENPQTVIWLWLFIAQHNDRKGDRTRALEYIKKAEEHTPTLVDVYRIKGKILKRMGQVSEAAEAMESARILDTADRYINTKATLYHIRADNVPKAVETISLFSGSPDGNNLWEIQMMWAEIEIARSWMRQGEIGKALVRLMSMKKYYEDWKEDEFDFHTYCLRKVTLRAYADLLRFESNMKETKYYKETLSRIVDCYLILHKQKGNESEKLTSQLEEMTLEEKKAMSLDEKRRKQRERRDAKRKEKHEDNEGVDFPTTNSTTTATSEASSAETKEDDTLRITVSGSKVSSKGANDEVTKDGKPLHPLPVEDDPEGKVFVENNIDFLEEAKKHMNMLDSVGELALKDPQTQFRAFDVWKNAGKIVLVLRSVYRLLKSSPRDEADIKETRDICLQVLNMADEFSKKDSSAAVVFSIVEEEMRAMKEKYRTFFE